LFAYVDEKIREKLELDERLVDLDREGRPINGEGQNPYLSLLGPIPLPRQLDGEEIRLQWYVFVHRMELNQVLAAANEVRHGGEEQFRHLIHSNMSVNSILATDGFLSHDEPLVRVHSSCMTGDVFGSQRCECGPQLDEAFRAIRARGGGAVVYMSGHEGRGIGLWAKAVTYLLQDEGQNTYQANVSLGLPEDSRDFTDAAVALRYLLRGRPLRLLSNNPLKREHLERAGQPVSAMEPLVVGVCDYNIRYLRTKRTKGHQLPEL
jgi:GTP cyclohydrolase II